MNIRDILEKIKSGFSWFVGNHETQYVNEDETNAKKIILEEVKAGRISKTDAQAAIDALERVDSEGNNLGSRIEDSVQLYSGDIEGIKVEKTPKAKKGTSSGGRENGIPVERDERE